MNDGNLAAEAAEHFSKFETDIAAAYDEQVLGQCAQFHDGRVRQVAGLLQACDLRNDRPRAGINEDPGTFQGLVAHAYLMRPGEASLASVKLELVFTLLDLL